jgi:integrase
MKESKNEPKQVGKESAWQKTPYANLIRYVPSGAYYARIRVRGKLLWKSLKTDTITIAKLRLADLEKQERGAVEKQVNVERGRMTVGDALQILLERAKGKPNLKPRTRDYYDQRAHALRRSWPELERLDVRKVTKAQCLSWAANFGAKSSPIAFNHTASLLRRTFEIAIENGARYDNPAVDIEWAKERPKRLQLPEPDKFDALLDAIEHCGWVYAKDSADMVRFLAYGGFRKTEAANITWADCDFVKGKIIVRGDPVTGTKNSEVREVPMIPDMRRLLERIRENRPHDSPATRLIEFKDCRKALAHACERVGIPRITHHDLRHLFATRCIESGVDIPTVSRWLGHKDGGALAMRVYGHLRDTHSVEMAQRVSFSLPRPENVVPLSSRRTAKSGDSL